MFIAVCTGEKEKQAPQSYILLNDGLEGNSRGQHFCQSHSAAEAGVNVWPVMRLKSYTKKEDKLQTK